MLTYQVRAAFLALSDVRDTLQGQQHVALVHLRGHQHSGSACTQSVGRWCCSCLSPHVDRAAVSRSQRPGCKPELCSCRAVHCLEGVSAWTCGRLAAVACLLLPHALSVALLAQSMHLAATLRSGASRRATTLHRSSSPAQIEKMKGQKPAALLAPA